ncbi:NAD-dependent succinate-semialdehyde dehydrogenase [Chitinolyticbacter meiyuanensis]|uniref:NAD-dependent succinate-semialdehyde dehydrogenase n=1 Tax=Chitinolyticbacter meiyuanensis TaxID=682798 RepID=UPI0011E59E43|nr:NAD-dependent succinate-semialdehyde dehydrogenase [Chitinolyticbacter meiyuanensis]
MNASLQSLLQRDALIAGSWTATVQRFAVTDPATGSVIAEVASCGRSEARAAIAAAEAALPDWRALPAKSRAALLRRWYELMLSHQDELAEIPTREQGKPLAEARGEIAYAAGFVDWFAEEARRINGDVLEHPQADRRILVLKQPIGVCAAITPWNFPAAMITRKAGAALAAGCTMVVKPASQTPLTALALGALAIEAGLPPGVFNVVPGAASEVGAELAENPAVRKLSFTGSTEVGRTLMAQCAPTLKKLSLELGGNAPFIVFDDADIDAAVEGAIAAKFRNTGQTCVCANRFYVQAAVYDQFAEKLTACVAALKVGNGLDSGIEQGPLIDADALAKVEAHVADATANGARVLTGAKALGGTWYAPTVLADVAEGALLCREETFGPVAGLVKFQTELDAVRLANATEFGLAAYFYGQNLSRVFRVAEALEYGMVGINTGLFSNEVGPFGGVKQSGFGREGSKYGLAEYQELKYLCLGV